MIGRALTSLILLLLLLSVSLPAIQPDENSPWRGHMLYRCNLHSHTVYSDYGRFKGVQLASGVDKNGQNPWRASEKALKNGLDCLAVTDHGEQLSNWPWTEITFGWRNGEPIISSNVSVSKGVLGGCLIGTENMSDYIALVGNDTTNGRETKVVEAGVLEESGFWGSQKLMGAKKRAFLVGEWDDTDGKAGYFVKRSKSGVPFVLLRGFEWTGANDHMNVIGTRRYCGTTRVISGERCIVSVPKQSASTHIGPIQPITTAVSDLYDRVCDRKSMFDWVTKQDRAGCTFVCQFNHPTLNYEGNSNLAYPCPHPNMIDVIDATVDWNRVCTPVRHFALMELSSHATETDGCGNGTDPKTSNEYWFRKALQSGWRVAPTNNEDNHEPFVSGDYGSTNFRTGVYARAKSSSSAARVELMDALMRRCTFSSEDPKAELKFWVDENHPMGSILKIDKRVESSIGFHISGQAGSSHSILNIYLIEIRKSGDALQRLLKRNIRTPDADTLAMVKPHSDTICFYAKMLLESNRQLVSAPIWVVHTETDFHSLSGEPADLSGLWEGTTRNSAGVEYKDKVSILQKEDMLFITSRRTHVDNGNYVVKAYDTTKQNYFGEHHTSPEPGSNVRILEQQGNWTWSIHDKVWLSDDGEEIRSIYDYQTGEHQEGSIKRTKKFRDLPTLDNALSEFRGLVKQNEEADGGEVTLDSVKSPYLLVVLNYPGSHLELSVEGPDGKPVDLSSPVVTYLKDEIPARLYIKNPKSGTYKFTVKGIEVDGDAEPFWVISTLSDIGPDGKPVRSMGGVGSFGATGWQTPLLVSLMSGILILSVLCIGLAVYRRRLTNALYSHASNSIWLQIHEAGLSPQNYPASSSSISIGRDRTNDIVLNDPKVSSFHANIRKDGQRSEIVDLGSTNGTHVNGELVAQSVLFDGDMIEIGGTSIYYLVEDHQKASE